MPFATRSDPSIVLVDASGNLTQRLRSELVTVGFEVRTFTTASACLQTVEEGTAIGIVSEYDLPDFDGVNLLRSVRLSNPSLPFVLVPTEGTESIASEAIAAGVSGYVPQDDDTETIVSRIHDVLDEEASIPTEETHQRYQRLVRMAPAPINIFDETGRSIWGNRAVLDLLGLESLDELVGTSIFEFIHPDDYELANREFEEVIHDKDSVGPTSMKLLRPDGQVRHIQVATASGSYLGGDIGQAIIVDITRQEELYRQLKVLSTWLRHNIRNEMNVVHGLAGEIRDGDVENSVERARMIQNHVEHLVSQADREREMVELLVKHKTPVILDIDEILDAAIASIRSAYPAANIELVRSDSASVKAIPQLRSALDELIENAVLHNDSTIPNLWIEVDQPDRSTCTIRIRDDGPGIPENEQEILRMEQPIDQLNHGLGLGLMYAHTVVTQSHGSLRFSDNEPRGSVLTVRLPTASTGSPDTDRDDHHDRE